MCLAVLQAQTIDDFGRIALRADVSNAKNITDEARNMLETLLQQIATDNGIAASGVNPRFVITAKIDILTKDLVPGPPKMFSYNLKVTVFVGDIVENRIFSNASVSLTGVGASETKAYINALKKVKTGNPQFKTMLEEGKNEIVAYYRTNCEKIINEANALATQQKYGEAIYRLALVPDVCSDCYKRCLDLQGKLFTQKIESEGKAIYNQATALWAQSPDRENAGKVMSLISCINPQVSFIDDVQAFVQQLTASVEAQALREWEQAVQEYKNRLAEARQRADREYQLEQMRIKTCREVAMEYVKNQPKEIIYNNLIIW